MARKAKEIEVAGIRVIEKEYNAGFKARQDNKLPVANPHKKTEQPHKYHSWMNGWNMADLEADESLHTTSQEISDDTVYKSEHASEE